MKYILIFFVAFGLLFLSIQVNQVSALTPLYPNLKTLAPFNLRYDSAVINGSTHQVLRFSNTVWNSGEGPLELRGETVSTERTKVYQRIYNDTGGFTEQQVGEFIFHPAHNHWHFENFAEYELWTKAEYDKWIASGRVNGQAQKRGSKTTLCMMDTTKVQSLPGSPSTVKYGSCGLTLQGISVGWGDTYGYSLPEQWIDLGTSKLANGTYVLRSVVDHKKTLIESSSNQDPRESQQDNEAITTFKVKGNRISY